VSQIDLAAGVMRTDEIEIGPDQRRAAQRREDVALLWRFASDRPADSRSNPRGIGVAFGKPLRQRPDQVAVGIQAAHLKSRHAACDRPGSTIPERSLLSGIAHGQLSSFGFGSENTSRFLFIASCASCDAAAALAPMPAAANEKKTPLRLTGTRP